MSDQYMILSLVEEGPLHMRLSLTGPDGYVDSRLVRIDREASARFEAQRRADGWL